jgi:hypothetical protein
MMNSLQIDRLLSHIPGFVGVFPADKIPDIVHYPASFVVNTDKSGKPGTHWLGIYMPNEKTIEYFDTFGREPSGAIKEFVGQYENKKINHVRLQASYEISCGPHVIYFLIQRSKGTDFGKIITSLASDDLRDVSVKLFSASLASSIGASSHPHHKHRHSI